jgi:tRNA(fMet)-specific endonuclease VapC
VSLLLDTNICIAFLNGRDAQVRTQLLAQVPADVALCSVVKAELLYGARNSEHVDANLRRLGEFFAPFASLHFDDAAASWYGSIRAQLKKEGRMIGSNDLMIAAIALAADVTLVTRNDGEFQRVPGLRVDVW